MALVALVIAMAALFGACSLFNGQRYADSAYSVGSQARNPSFPRIRKDWEKVAPDAAAAIDRALRNDHLNLRPVSAQEASDIELDADPSFQWFGYGKASLQIGNSQSPVYSVFVAFGPYFASREMIGIVQVVDDAGPQYRFDVPGDEFSELLAILFPQQ